MHIGNTLKINYTIETNTVPRSRMWTNSSLKFSLQCNKAAASATRVLGMLRRTFTFNSKELFIFVQDIRATPS